MTEPSSRERAHEGTLRGVDLERVPQRRYLPSIARNLAPQRSFSYASRSLEASLRRRWGGLLGVAADDLLIFANPPAALGLVAAARLRPGDVALIAAPCGVDLAHTITAQGAAWVDVHRRLDGQLDAAALRRAAAAHPGASLWLEAPALLGGAALDEACALAAEVAAPLVLDAAWSRTLAGAVPDPWPTSLAALRISLYDPTLPREPLMTGLVCPPGAGPSLALLGGDVRLPLPLLERALAAVEALESTGIEAADAAREVALSAAGRALDADLPADPDGARLSLPRGGVLAPFFVRDGASEAFADALRVRGWHVAFWGGHPMDHLAAVDLRDPPPGRAQAGEASKAIVTP